MCSFRLQAFFHFICLGLLIDETMDKWVNNKCLSPLPYLFYQESTTRVRGHRCTHRSKVSKQLTIDGNMLNGRFGDGMEH